MQTYLPRVMCMLAPYVNSYRRLVRNTSAPINVRWGFDNRTVGLRVPLSDPANRRVENRVPSSDANPYLAIAASLACGYLGLVKELTPDRAIEGASNDPNFALPRSILDAVRLLERHAGAGRDFRHDLRAHLSRHQGDRIRDVHGRDQPVGTRISAAQRLSSSHERARRMRQPSPSARRGGSDAAFASPVLLPAAGRERAAIPAARQARAAPMSASSAAGSPVCRPRCIWPRPAPMSCSSRPTRSRAAHRGGTADRSIPASAATCSGWRKNSASSVPGFSGTCRRRRRRCSARSSSATRSPAISAPASSRRCTRSR